MVRNVGGDDGAGSDHRPFAHRMSADDGAVGSEAGSAFDEGLFIYAVHREGGAWNAHVGKDAGRSAKNIVFEFDALIDGDVVLDAASVADPDSRTYVDILPERTVPSDDCAFLYVAEVPDFRAIAEHYTLVNITAGMYENCIVEFLHTGFENYTTPTPRAMKPEGPRSAKVMPADSPARPSSRPGKDAGGTLSNYEFAKIAKISQITFAQCSFGNYLYICASDNRRDAGVVDRGSLENC